MAGSDGYGWVWVRWLWLSLGWMATHGSDFFLSFCVEATFKCCHLLFFQKEVASMIITDQYIFIQFGLLWTDPKLS